MKNKILIILLLVLTFSLCSCIKKNEDTIKQISSDFIVNDNIKSNYLYQHSSNLLIEGKCEPGVRLYAGLYSKLGISTSSESCIASEDGTFSIILDTPGGSFDEYKLIIKDYHEKFIHEYTGLLFGEVNLLLGDSIINEYNVIDEDANLENIFYLDATTSNLFWNKVTNVSELSSFMFYVSSIYKDTSKYKNMPIGFMNVLYDKTLIEEWLSLDAVNNSNDLVKNFLIENGKYFETPYQRGQMSYIYNNVLMNLKNTSFGNIIYSAGLYEFKTIYGKINSQDAYTSYTRMLLMSLKGICDIVHSYNNLSIIQINNQDIDHIEILRDISSKVCNRIEDAYLIPTYDLIEDEKGTFSEKLAKRFYDITVGKKEVSQYANYYITDDLMTLTIEFSNTNKLVSKDFNIQIYDYNNNLIEFEKDKIDLYYNKIIIDLSYEVESYDEELDEMIITTLCYNVSKVSYSEVPVITSGIIYNNNRLPIIPFSIIINENEEVKLYE